MNINKKPSNVLFIRFSIEIQCILNCLHWAWSHQERQYVQALANIMDVFVGAYYREYTLLVHYCNVKSFFCINISCTGFNNRACSLSQYRQEHCIKMMRLFELLSSLHDYDKIKRKNDGEALVTNLAHKLMIMNFAWANGQVNEWTL